MPKRVKTPDGVTHTFPDDATDDEISAVLNGGQTAAMMPKPEPMRGFDEQAKVGDVVMSNGRRVKVTATFPTGAFQGDLVGPHPEAKIGAAPESDDFEKFYGRPNPVGPTARAFMTSPLAEPTGIESVDALTSPLNLALAAGSIGRVAAKPGLKLAARVGAAGAEVAGQVLPVVKYEVAKHALEAMHVPGPVAAVIAMGISGYKKGAKVPTETPTTAPAPRSAPAAPAPQPAPQVAPAVESAPAVGAPVPRMRVLPTQESFPAAQEAFRAAGLKPLPAEVNNVTVLMGKGNTPEEALRIVVGNRPQGAPTPAAPPAAASKIPALTAEEVAMGQKLMARGKTQQEALDAILAQRAFLKIPGTQSSAATRAELDARNAAGKIKTPSAQTARERRGY